MESYESSVKKPGDWAGIIVGCGWFFLFVCLSDYTCRREKKKTHSDYLFTNWREGNKPMCVHALLCACCSDKKLLMSPCKPGLRFDVLQRMWVKLGSHNEARVFLGISLPVSLELRNIWAFAHLSSSSRGCTLCLYRVYKITSTGYTSIVLVFPPPQASWCVVYCLKPASLCVYVASFSSLSSYVFSWDPTWSRRRGIGTFCFLMSICVYCTTCACPPVHACVLISIWPFICT